MNAIWKSKKMAWLTILPTLWVLYSSITDCGTYLWTQHISDFCMGTIIPNQGILDALFRDSAGLIAGFFIGSSIVLTLMILFRRVKND